MISPDFFELAISVKACGYQILSMSAAGHLKGYQAAFLVRGPLEHLGDGGGVLADPRLQGLGDFYNESVGALFLRGTAWAAGPGRTH